MDGTCIFMYKKQKQFEICFHAVGKNVYDVIRMLSRSGAVLRISDCGRNRVSTVLPIFSLLYYL